MEFLKWLNTREFYLFSPRASRSISLKVVVVVVVVDLLLVVVVVVVVTFCKNSKFQYITYSIV